MGRIRIKYLTDEGLSYLKTSFNEHLQYYIDNKHDELLELLNSKEYLLDSAYEIDDFTNKLVFLEDTDAADLENIKIVYDAMKDIPDFVMMDDRFWAAINHTFMWDYIRRRRKEEAFSKGVKDQKEAIYNSFFTHTRHGKKRGTFVNCVSRLWWAGRLTYESGNDDKYYLTAELCKKGFPSTIVPFSSSNIMGREETRRALLSVVMELRKKGIDVKRDDIFAGIRYLNLYAGITIIDMISYDELYDIVERYYKKLYNI